MRGHIPNCARKHFHLYVSMRYIHWNFNLSFILVTIYEHFPLQKISVHVPPAIQSSECIIYRYDSCRQQPVKAGGNIMAPMTNFRRKFSSLDFSILKTRAQNFSKSRMAKKLFFEKPEKRLATCKKKLLGIVYLLQLVHKH